jgi:hypothetical protein
LGLRGRAGRDEREQDEQGAGGEVSHEQENRFSGRGFRGRDILPST